MKNLGLSNPVALTWAAYLLITEILAVTYILRTETGKLHGIIAASLFVLAGVRLLAHAASVRHLKYYFLSLGIAVAAAIAGFAMNFTDPDASMLRALSALMIISPVALAFLPPTNPELERLAGLKTIILDKSGALASGVPELKALKSIDPRISELALMQRVASLLHKNEDLLAKTVCAAARSKSLELLEVEQFKAIDGQGVTGVVSQRRTLVGSPGFLRAEGVQPGPLESLAINLTREGQMVALVGSEGRAVGIIAVSDPLSPEASAGVQAAKAHGLSVVVISSDSPAAAQAMGEKLGATAAYGDVTAAKKGEILKQIQKDSGDRALLVDEDIKALLEKIAAAKNSVKKTHGGDRTVLLYNTGASVAAALLPLPPIAAVILMIVFTMVSSWIYRQRITV